MTRNGHSVPDVDKDTRADVGLNKISPIHFTKTKNKQQLNGDFLRRNLPLKNCFYWDSLLIGFGLRTSEAGRKTWVVRYRRGKSYTRTTIGTAFDPIQKYRPMGPTEARKRAKQILGDAAHRMHSITPKGKKAKTRITFAHLVSDYLSDRPFDWKESSEKSARGIIRNHLLPAFGNRSVANMTRGDIMQWRDSHGKTETGVNKRVVILSGILKYAEALGYREEGSNPAKGIKRLKSKQRDRPLSSAEFLRLGRLLKTLDVDRPELADAFRLVTLTGARKGEIGTLKWEYVKLPILDLPDSKTGPKKIILCSYACKILERMRPANATGHIFPSTRAGPIDLTAKWDRLRRSAGLPEVCLHDLRHSYGTLAIRNGVTLPKIARLLGHVDLASTEIYARMHPETPRGAADRISNSIAKLVGALE